MPTAEEIFSYLDQNNVTASAWEENADASVRWKEIVIGPYKGRFLAAEDYYTIWFEDGDRVVGAVLHRNRRFDFSNGPVTDEEWQIIKTKIKLYR